MYCCNMEKTLLPPFCKCRQKRVVFFLIKGVNKAKRKTGEGKMSKGGLTGSENVLSCSKSILRRVQ